MSLTVVGSIAFDSVKTPFGERDRMLGGAAVHFSLAASFFTEVRPVGPVGDDFGASEFEKTMVRNVTAIDPGAQKDLKDYPTWHLPRPPYPGPTPHALKIPFRGSKDFRVVNVKELAELFYDALTGTSSIDHGAPITSAEFGVQMTDSPGRVTITVRKQHG